MTLTELQEQFAVPGVVSFQQTSSGLISVHVTSPAATATVFLHGAHITEWTPAGEGPVLFLSARSDIAPGKAIRGGVPVIFPWFGPRSDGHTGPAHGFARTQEWDLAFAAVAGGEVHLTFTLGPSEQGRALGFDNFRVAYQVTVGSTLTMTLTVANEAGAAAPLRFEEALHTYFAVGDAREVAIEGLGETPYLDKVDDMKHKLQPPGALVLTGRTDRVYVGTTATCLLQDDAGSRTITIEKSGSRSTVVWNPWDELTKTIADMEPDGWLGMTCVESANVGDDAITLAPGETHTMRVVLSVEDSVEEMAEEAAA